MGNKRSAGQGRRCDEENWADAASELIFPIPTNREDFIYFDKGSFYIEDVLSIWWGRPPSRFHRDTSKAKNWKFQFFALNVRTSGSWRAPRWISINSALHNNPSKIHQDWKNFWKWFIWSNRENVTILLLWNISIFQIRT